MNENWSFLNFEHAKIHVVPNFLLADVIADLEARNHPLIKSKLAKSVFIDLPGMISFERPVETIKLDLLNINIPSEDVEYFAFNLKDLKQRVFSSKKTYFKLHGFLICIVLSDEQKELFQASLEQIRQQSNLRAEQHFEETQKRFNKPNTLMKNIHS
jgi:hypothetical protein